MSKNINPIYLQEVSQKYYNNVLNNSRQHKAALRLAKRWSNNNPDASNEEKIHKLANIIQNVHKKYDKARGRNPIDTNFRNEYIDNLLYMNAPNVPEKYKITQRDKMFDFIRSKQAHKKFLKSKLDLKDIITL